MTKYISKPDSWFKEGTECELIEDYRDEKFPEYIAGLFRGIYIVGPDEGYDKFWHRNGYKENDEVEMNEVCSFDEFEIIEY